MILLSQTVLTNLVFGGGPLVHLHFIPSMLQGSIARKNTYWIWVLHFWYVVSYILSPSLPLENHLVKWFCDIKMILGKWFCDVKMFCKMILWHENDFGKMIFGKWFCNVKMFCKMTLEAENILRIHFESKKKAKDSCVMAQFVVSWL